MWGLRTTYSAQGRATAPLPSRRTFFVSAPGAAASDVVEGWVRDAIAQRGEDEESLEIRRGFIETGRVEKIKA